MSPRLRPGQLVASRYRLERPLARGGMGSLWVARHVELDVEIAIKFSAMERGPDHDLRFRREARAAAQLKSPHIVQVFDYGFDGGEPFIAMELLEGESLRELLDREGRLSLPRTAAIVAQVGKGLGVAHEAGIVHRDLKPSNLFLARAGGEQIVKILDFGIARASAEAGGDAPGTGPNLGGEATRAGTIVGSPSYMSPEQARGEPVDARSDLWSLAVVVYRMLTGAEPFTGASAAETLERIAAAPLPSAGVELDPFFARGLARAKERRFRSAAELVETLGGLAARLPGQAPAKVTVPAGAARLGRTAETVPIEPATRQPRRAAALALSVAAGVGLGAYLLAKGEAPLPSSSGAAAVPSAPAPRLSATSEAAPVAAPTAQTAQPSERQRPAAAPAARRAALRTPPPGTAPSATPVETEVDPVFGLKP